MKIKTQIILSALCISPGCLLSSCGTTNSAADGINKANQSVWGLKSLKTGVESLSR